MAQTYSILNFKGGCAKTTTAINLAHAMVLLGKKVLVVDLDFQCNATSNLGFKPSMGDTLFEILTQKDIKSMPIYSYKNNFDYIPSSKLMKDINDTLVSRKNREQILKKLLSVTQPLYDYILIDCPPNGGLLNTNAMAAAEKLIIPVECEAYGVQGVSTILDEINDIRDSGVNEDLEILGFLMTRYDGRQTLHKGIRGQLRTMFGDKVFNAYISKNTAISKATAMHMTVFDFDPKSTGASDYMQLAREITGSKKKVTL